MINLYDKSETNFSTLGLGSLADAISCKVHTVLNGIFELEMQYPMSGLRYKDLKISNIIKAVSEKGGDPQLFDIYAITKPMNGVVTVYASHVSGRKQFIPIMPCSAGNVGQAFTEINAHAAGVNPFTFWTDKQTVANFNLKTPASLGQVLGGMEGSLLDVYRGEYEFDNFTIKFWNRRGQDNGVSLRYGKNITNIEQEESIASTITGICPFWTSDEGGLVTLSEKVIESPNAANFPFKRTVTMDFSSEFDEQPTEAQLRSKTQTYITANNIGVPSVGMDVTYENLADYEEYKDFALIEQVRLGDTVHVYFEPLDITADARVTETIYDSISEKYVKIRIGAVKASLQQTINSNADDAKKAADSAVSRVSNNLEQAFENALNALSGADGGNVVIRQNEVTGKPYEILIMDTDDVTTAKNVLRLNMNGLGVSSNGINGPYTVAATGAGLVATAITTGTLDASAVNVTNLNASNISSGTLNASLIGSGITQSQLASALSNLINTANSNASTALTNAASAQTAATSAASAASAAQTTANGALKNAVTLYYRTMGTTAPAKPTAQVTSTAQDTDNQWTLLLPRPKTTASGQATFYTCEQYQDSAGTYSWSTVRTMPLNNYIGAWCAANDATAINGGKIYTGSVTADKITVNDLQAFGATIGDFQIDSNSIHTKNVAVTSNATNSVALSSSTFTRTITGTSRSNLKFAIGANFGVASDGTLYANGANITNINGSNITAGSISVSKLSDLDVGGRNYAWAVSEIHHPSIFSIRNCTYTYDAKQNGKYVLTATGNAGFQQVWLTSYDMPADLVGQTVVFHADKIQVSRSVLDARIYLNAFDSSGTEVLSQALVVGTLQKSFTIPSNAVALRILIRVAQTYANATAGDKLTVSGLKLEKGTVPTDWSPAPEDSPDRGDLATSGATVIHGGNITTNTIRADAINVTDLTAFGATIGGWSISSTGIYKDVTISGVKYHPYMGAPASPTLTSTAFGIMRTENGANTWPVDIRYDGTLVATKANITGTVTASAGSIGGWSISSTAIEKLWPVTAGTASTQYDVVMSASTSNTGNTPFGVRHRSYDGSSYGSYSWDFYVTYAGKTYARNAEITGSITANTGYIGGTSGFVIEDKHLRSGALTSTSAGAVALTTENFTRSINSVSRANLRFAIGSKFGVASDGTVYASGADISGAVTATSGTIAGWTLASTSLYKEVAIGGVTYRPYMQALSAPTAGNVAFGLSQTEGGTTTYPFRVTYDGRLIATKADISGKITAGEGSIAGWNLSSTMLYKDATIGGVSYRPFIQASASPTATSTAFGIRKTENGTNSYPFDVRYDGTLVATQARITGTITSDSATITGGSINITTTSSSQNKISLNYEDDTWRYSTVMNPTQLTATIVAKSAGSTGTGTYGGGAMQVQNVWSSGGSGTRFGADTSRFYGQSRASTSASWINRTILNFDGLEFRNASNVVTKAIYADTEANAHLLGSNATSTYSYVTVSDMSKYRAFVLVACRGSGKGAMASTYIPYELARTSVGTSTESWTMSAQNNVYSARCYFSFSNNRIYIVSSGNSDCTAKIYGIT